MLITIASRTRLLGAVLAFTLPLPLAACDSDSSATDPEVQNNIVETAEAAGSFTTLLAALDAADLDEVLSGPGPFTVFAPTDEAFSRIPEDVLADLLADPELLTAVLTYHVVPGSVSSDAVSGLSSAKTVNGKDIGIQIDEGNVFIDGIRVVTTDIEASNGIIHVIDGVLTPEPIANIIQTARDAGGFTTLLAAVEAAGLTDVLSAPGPFTVFAPTDEAFAEIPDADLDALLADPDALAAVLTYHVVAGEVLAADVVGLASAETVNGAEVDITVTGSTVEIDEANVIATDILARNGVIHVIDQVLMP